MRYSPVVFAFLAVAAGAIPASAHVTLSEKSAKPGTAYVAHFRVGHGCSGSPTTALTIEIPAVVTEILPQSKPGWTVALERNGSVRAVVWKGGPLPATQAGDFAVTLKLPASETTLIFPTTQTCASGEEHWIDPAGGKNPAPTLMVSKTAPAGGMTMDMSMPGMEHGQDGHP